MIIDLKQFQDEERAYWEELDRLLSKLEKDAGYRPSLAEAKRLHYLYERGCCDLARIEGYASETQLRQYLEALVSRAYAEIHETRGRRCRFAPGSWLFGTAPRTFRRHLRPFLLALLITLGGGFFGAGVLALDPNAKEVIMPFPHLLQDPSERVAKEEASGAGRLANRKARFAATLMTHNTRVSILAAALGMTYGIGTVCLLLFNGVILGAVSADYLLAAEGPFLFGWLLPHGAIEIPAILIAGQAGLVMAHALIGWGRGVPLKERLRNVSGDVVTLLGLVALMLLWAGVVESFLSQYHAPVVPYAAKIAFGLVELLLLALYLGWGGARGQAEGAVDA